MTRAGGRIVKRDDRVVPSVVVDAAADAARLRAEARALLERAHQDAEALRRDAEAAGLAEGRDRGAAELLETIAAARAEANAASEAAARSALPLAVKMAERIVGEAIEADPARMARVAQAALATSRVRAGRVVLRVHPEDRRAIETQRASLLVALPAIDLHIADDERVGRAGCVVETPTGRVDARLATQLAALERALAGRARGTEL